MLVIITVSVLISLVFAPLGCLVLWKRYVYFGDGLAHASMLAGVISVMAGVPIFYAGMVTSGLFAYSVFKLRDNSGNNAAIGLITSIMIALSLTLSYLPGHHLNIVKYLIGDIMLASSQDIACLLCALAVVVIFFTFWYKDLLLIILSRDIAASRGVRTGLLELAFLAILSFAILSTIQAAGALLTSSMIIIPAMIARLLARSPAGMIGLATLFSLVMNISGVMLSLYIDLPFAPVIILSGGAAYIIVASINYYINSIKTCL